MSRPATPRAILYLISLSAIFSSGCRSTAPFPSATYSVPEGFPNHSVSEILGQLPSMPAAFDTLYAETSVAVSSPEENGRFSTRIAYRRGDSLLVRIRFPLGIEGARVLVASDSAWIYDRVHEEVVFGSVDAVARLLPAVMIGPNMVEDALDFVRPDPAVAWIHRDRDGCRCGTGREPGESGAGPAGRRGCRCDSHGACPRRRTNRRAP